MVRSDMAEQREDEHLALIASSYEAAAWCADASNRGALAKMLQQRAFPALTEKVIKQSLASADAPVFHGKELHRPAPEKASWLLGEMFRHGLLSQDAAGTLEPLQAFCPELYDRAISLSSKVLTA